MNTDNACATINDQKETRVFTIFVDGAGCRIDGTGSGFA
jgi:hypothetical protein